MRTLAAFGLGLVQPSTAVDPLLRAIHDPSVGTRANAVWALGHLDSTSAVPALIRLLREDAVASVRRTAAWALGQLDLQAAPKGLIEALRAALAEEKDSHTRKAEVRALIHSGERSEQLTELLQSKDPEVREAAIRGIAGHDEVDPWPWPEPRPRPFP